MRYIIEVRSKKSKHRGAVFIKKNNTHDDFVCKVYAGHDKEVQVIRSALENYYHKKENGVR